MEMLIMVWLNRGSATRRVQDGEGEKVQVDLNCWGLGRQRMMGQRGRDR